MDFHIEGEETLRPILLLIKEWKSEIINLSDKNPNLENTFPGIAKSISDTKFLFLSELYLISNRIDSVEVMPRMSMPNLRTMNLGNSYLTEAATTSTESEARERGTGLHSDPSYSVLNC